MSTQDSIAATLAVDALQARYTLPVIEELTDSAEEIGEKQARVRELAKKRNAIILAHHYMRPEVQETADCVADSLRLSQTAAKTGAEGDPILRCALYGRNRVHYLSGQDRSASGPARGLLAFRVADGGRTAGVEGSLSGRGGGFLHQTLRRR